VISSIDGASLGIGTAANFLFLPVVNDIVDYSTGANYSHKPNPLVVTLIPLDSTEDYTLIAPPSPTEESVNVVEPPSPSEESADVELPSPTEEPVDVVAPLSLSEEPVEGEPFSPTEESVDVEPNKSE
tara:strand:- start:789 stop:1172 length:384 start_codon:yes stop_codon:yes gene_type:complete